MTLTHLTTNTGHVARTRRADVADRVVELLWPIVAGDGGPIPHITWWIDIWRQIDQGAALPGTAVFQVAPGPAAEPAGKLPYVICVACWRTDRSPAAWAVAQQIAAMAPPPPHRLPHRLPAVAPAVPWLTATLMPGALTLTYEQIDMLGDLERCLFWTLAEAAP